MIKICLSLTLVLLLFLSSFAQEDVRTSEYDDLSQQLSSELTTKGLSKITAKAKDIFKTNKKQFKNDKAKLANTILNFALFRKQLFQTLKKKTIDSKFARDEILAHLRFSKENAAKMEILFEQSIENYGRIPRIENDQLATAKFELANYLDSSNIQGKDFYNAKKQFERANKIQELYLGAYTLWKNLRNKNDELVLVVGFHLANSYLRTSDFEKALPHYEIYIEGVTEKFGQKSEDLLPALRISAVIWNMLGREDLVGKLSKQISNITNKEEDFGKVLLSLNQRAKSFKYKGLKQTFSKLTISITPRIIIDRNDPSNKTRTNAGLNRTIDSLGYYRTFSMPYFKEAKVIRTVIEVDIEGKVVYVNAETDDLKLKNKVEQQVRKWEFTPFIYKEKPMKIKGLVNYSL